MPRELHAGETAAAYAAMSELRPHVGSRAEFVRRVDVEQRADGYRLVGAFEEGEEDAVAAAGFRLGRNLAWGRHVYVDDLVTREAFRGRGHGGALMRWLLDEARRLGCEQLHLDSGVHRHDAHRLYLNAGLVISAHHFARLIRG